MMAPICAQQLTGRPTLRLPNFIVSAEILHEGSFELQRSGPGLTNWTAMTNFNALPGTNSFTDTITNQQRYYRMVRFTNAPVITTQPVGVTNFYDQEVRLVGAATGSWPLKYFWYRDGELVPGATSNVLVYAGRTNLSGSYVMAASNSWGIALSTAVAVKTIHTVPSSIMGKKIQYVIKGQEGGFIGTGSFETTYGNFGYQTTSSNFNLNDIGQWQYGVLTQNGEPSGNTGRALWIGGFVYPNGAMVDMTFTNVTEGTYNLQLPNFNGRQFGEFKVVE